MKTKLVFAMTLVSINLVAQVPLNVSVNQTNSPDKYSFQKPLESKKADLFADEKSMEYIHLFSIAIDNPNTLVEVDKDSKLLKVLSFTKKLVKTNKKEIIYDDSKKTISLIETKRTEEKNSFIWISAVLLIALMVTSNTLFSLNQKEVAQVIAFFISLATLASTLNATTEHLISLIALVLFFVVCIIVMYTDKSGGIVALVLIASLAIPGIIICITIVVVIFHSGFTFCLLALSSIVAMVAAFNKELSDEDKRKDIASTYTAFSFLYYIIMAVHVILLFVAY